MWQAGTSHDLGDNFARAFGTQFLDEAGELVHPQQTSWGASTRLIGGIIMTHGEKVFNPPVFFWRIFLLICLIRPMKLELFIQEMTWVSGYRRGWHQSR